MPAEAGWAVLRRRPGTGPVALTGGRMRFLVADGAAAELPGLLDWLEWGGIPLDLRASPAAQLRWPPALWLRPPGRAALSRLPAVRLAGGGDAAGPDLVRLVSAAATACHRLALLEAPAG